MLSQAAFDIGALSTVIAAAALTPDNVYPCFHNKKARQGSRLNLV
jgi:hypothetical protein